MIDVRTIKDHVQSTLADEPALAVLAGGFGLLAHILALRGVVARSTGEPERKAELEKLIGELETKLQSGNVEE